MLISSSGRSGYGNHKLMKLPRPTTCRVRVGEEDHDRVRHTRTGRLRCELDECGFNLVEFWLGGWRRLFGDEQQHLGGRQERASSATDKIDMHGEFDDRSAQMMPVKIVHGERDRADVTSSSPRQKIVKLSKQSKLRSSRRSQGSSIWPTTSRTS